MKKSVALLAGFLSLGGMSETANAGGDPWIGEIALVGYTFCPRGWTEAAGQLLPIAQYQALFSLYGTIYGGDGRTTFGLPDLRGRAAVGQGTGPGLTNRPMGQKGGSETNPLTMPRHNHGVTVQINGTTGVGNSPTPAGNLNALNASQLNYASGSGVAMATNAATVTQTDQGGGADVNNMQPFQVLRYCVSLTGIFPSRN